MASFDSLAFDTDAFDTDAFDFDSAVNAVLTGTITTATETDIVNGGETIVLTLTGDTWVAAGVTFNAVRQAIIDGLDASATPATGWNNEVRDKELVTAVIRTSATVVTITLTASALYNISVDETITATIPASSLVTSVSGVIASPTFDITSTGAFQAAWTNTSNVLIQGGLV